MPQRFEQGRIRYKIDQVRQRIRVRFEDKFSCRYLNTLSLKQFLPSDIMKKYKSRKKDGNMLEFKLRQQQSDEIINRQIVSQQIVIVMNQKLNYQRIDHSMLVSWLQSTLDMQYCYFKSLPNNMHIVRNYKFKRILSDNVFRQLYPQIHHMIMIESQTNLSSSTQKFIIQSIHDEQQQHHQEEFRNGELIIYVEREKKRSIKQIVKYLQSYTRESVVYGLDGYCGMPGLKREDVSVDEIRAILEKVVRWLQPEISVMAKSIRLLIKSISIYAPDHRRQRYVNFQNRFGVDISLQGMFQSLPQFYFTLDCLFKYHPITIGKVDNIQFSSNLQKMQEQYSKQGIMLFFGSYQAVGIINLTKNFTNWVQFKRSLRKGLHIISVNKGFTLEQMEVLIREYREVQNFINDSFMDLVDYDYKPIDQKSFFIRCERELVEKFVARARDYLRKNQRVQVKRQEFITEFQLFLFKKLIQKHIQQKYPTVSFLIKDGLLYSRSKKEDLDDLRSEMVYQRRKMLKKIVRLPCVRQLKTSHLYQIIDDQFQNQRFCNQSNTKTIHYLFNQKQDIYFRPLSSISQCHELLITIIDQYYQQFQFFIQKFQQNSLSLQKYHKYLQGKDQGKIGIERMVSYSMSKSKYVNEMLVWFVEHDNRGWVDGRRLKWDIRDFVEKFKHNDTLYFAIPQSMWSNQHYFSQFFTSLFNQLYCQSTTIKIPTITIFYQQPVNLSHNIQFPQLIRHIFQKNSSNCFQLRSQMRLTLFQIQRIRLMEGWMTSYWDSENQRNGVLSVVNSIVFGYEKMRRKKEFKVPLMLKHRDDIGGGRGSQYLLALKYGVYYKLLSNYQVTEHKISSHPGIKQFATIIQKYFTFLQYFVVYMNDDETEIETKIMYYWESTMASSMSSGSKILPGQQRVKRFEINQEGKLIPKKNSQVDIFVKKVDIIPKFIIETHVDFLTEVKRIIFSHSNQSLHQK